MSKLVDESTLQATVGTIREAVDSRIIESRKDTAKVDETTGKVIADQLPVPVVSFNGFYSGFKEPSNASIGGEYNICFHTGVHRFVAEKAGMLANADVFSNFPEILKYQNGPLEHPFPDRLFKNEQDGELYQFEDGELKNVTNFGDYMKSSEYQIMTAEEAVAMVQQAFASNDEEE